MANSSFLVMIKIQGDISFVAITEGGCPFAERILFLIERCTGCDEGYLHSDWRLGKRSHLAKENMALDLEVLSGDLLLTIREDFIDSCFYILPINKYVMFSIRILIFNQSTNI